MAIGRKPDKEHEVDGNIKIAIWRGDDASKDKYSITKRYRFKDGKNVYTNKMPRQDFIKAFVYLLSIPAIEANEKVEKIANNIEENLKNNGINVGSKPQEEDLDI